MIQYVFKLLTEIQPGTYVESPKFKKTVSRPLIIAALPVREPRDISKILSVRNIVDLVELRIDYMEDPFKLDYYALKDERVLITLRDVEEGGFRKHPDETKIRLLKMLDDYGMLYDVEMRFLEKYGGVISYENKIVSYHNFSNEGIQNQSILRENVRAYSDKALIVKVATTPFPGYRSFLMSLLELGDNIAVMPMSPNAQERLAFTFLGSKILFCCIDTPTALGQIKCDHVRVIIDTVNRFTLDISSSFNRTR